MEDCYLGFKNGKEKGSDRSGLIGREVGYYRGFYRGYYKDPFFPNQRRPGTLNLFAPPST